MTVITTLSERLLGAVTCKMPTITPWGISVAAVRLETDGIANWVECLAMVTFLMPTIISLVALIRGEL